jgi:hypothetical protein
MKPFSVIFSKDGPQSSKLLESYYMRAEGCVVKAEFCWLCDGFGEARAACINTRSVADGGGVSQCGL